jgi:hypothetical protein
LPSVEKVGFIGALNRNMKVEHSIGIEGYPLTALAKRVDRSWGHAIEVSVVEANGSALGKLVFACHPEFPGFDEWQAMPTEALIDVVRKRLSAAVVASLPAFDSGIATLFRFNSPDDRWDRACPDFCVRGIA